VVPYPCSGWPRCTRRAAPGRIRRAGSSPTAGHAVRAGGAPRPRGQATRSGGGARREVAARAAYRRSRRAARPVVRVNCGAIPPELADSELFGRECGRFTGAAAASRDPPARPDAPAPCARAWAAWGATGRASVPRAVERPPVPGQRGTRLGFVREGTSTDPDHLRPGPRCYPIKKGRCAQDAPARMAPKGLPTDSPRQTRGERRLQSCKPESDPPQRESRGAYSVWASG
jgi:hypothetical protein